MKVFGIVILGLLSLGNSPAHGYVETQGAFVPKICGQQVEAPSFASTVEIQQVCFGKIVGEQSQFPHGAVSFQMSDGTNPVFRVLSTASSYIETSSAAIQGRFYLGSVEGERIMMDVTHGQNGRIEEVEGEVRSIKYRAIDFSEIYSFM